MTPEQRTIVIEALKDSLEVLVEEHTEAVRKYSGLPSREARLHGLAQGIVRHQQAIAIMEAEPIIQNYPEKDSCHKLVEDLLYCVEAWDRGCERSDYWRDRSDAIEAAKAWLQITPGTRERKALTEAELNALHDKLGGRPVVATYNESKVRNKP